MATERKALPVIDPTRCTGCGWCVGVCPPHVLSLQAAPGWQKKSTLHDADGCTGCALCAVRCPFDAIAMRRPQAASPGDHPD
ncbi:ATP-binding protein [Hydrogenophaga sp.]|uniref:ATP-binding protein n=1 Tax=Hydrogenophaga sp. TaxID=1904254 RepID=UPI003489C4BD